MTATVEVPGRTELPQRLVNAWLDAAGFVTDLEADLNEMTVDNPYRRSMEALLASERRRLMVLDIEWRRLREAS